MPRRLMTGRGGWRGLGGAVLAVAAAVPLLACASGDAAARLSNGAASPEQLAAEVLEAVAAGDRTTLERLALSETEFRAHIWPKLPASRPEVGMPADYLWADLSAKSRAGLAATLADIGGQRLTLERVTSTRASQDYRTFRIHPDVRLVVRDAAGRRAERRVFGSLVEAGGIWKVYSYIVD